MQYRPKIRNIVLHLSMKNVRLASYHEMLNGNDHGKHMTYYRSGQIANEYFTVNNTIDGIITEYSENGEILRQFEYRKGTFYRALEGIFVEVEE